MAVAQEYLNIGTQYGITYTQSWAEAAATGRLPDHILVPGLNGFAEVFYDASGKVYSVFTPKDAACGWEVVSPGRGVPNSPIKSVTFESTASNFSIEPAVFNLKIGELFPEVLTPTITSQQALAGAAAALNLVWRQRGSISKL